VKYGAGILAGLLWWGSAHAADVQFSATTSYDSNLYEALGAAQSGMTSQVSMGINGVVWQSPEAALKIEQHAGIKRFWRADSGLDRAGDVLVEQFFINGSRRIGTKSALSLRTGMKFKQATRTPREETYLRGMVDGHFGLRLGKGLTSSLLFGFGGDDSRDPLLPETRYRSAGLDLVYARRRNFSTHLRTQIQWVDYDRSALVLNGAGQVVPGVRPQADRAASVNLGFQLFAGVLVQGDYSLHHNASNGFGYGYWAHRLQGLAVRQLGWDVDAQVFVQFHVRLYDESVPSLLGNAAETDAYEQSLVILKLTRQLSKTHAISSQYGFYRNGARQGDGFYRKNVVSLVIETKL
jgi:hypothetical protein